MNSEDGEGRAADDPESEKSSPYEADDPESGGPRKDRWAALEDYGRIGSRWRWFDVPYRLMFWLSSGRLKGALPHSIRRLLNRGMNFLYAFNDLERLRSMPADDPLFSLKVPRDERIKVSGVWVVELFPPSEFVQLRRSIERNGWDRTELFPRGRETQAEWVEGARRNGSWSWSRLALVQDKDSKMFGFDTKKERLPEPFEFVSVTAIQMGASLTAVVGFFRFNERDGYSSIDEVRRATQEPALVWRWLKRPLTLDRRAAAKAAMQGERQRIHDVARDWMRAKIPGHFSDTGLGQPVLDLVLFESFDPTVHTDTVAAGDALAGLGVEARPFLRFSSHDVPGVCFLPGDEGLSSRRLVNSWLAVGRYATVEAATDPSGYGERPLPSRTLAYRYDEEMQSLLVHVGIRRYVRETRETYSKLSDYAHARHSRFKPRENDRLARQLLETSLDLPLVARDIKRTWSIWPRAISLTGESRSSREENRKWNALHAWGEDLKDSLDELIEVDETYRDVLSTAASLTGTSQNTRLARWALLVAFASLIVAAVTLVVAVSAP